MRNDVTMRLLCSLLLSLCLTIRVTDGIEAFVEPQLILLELGDADVNCTVEGETGPVEYRWTRPTDPEWTIVYTQVLELSQVIPDEAGIYVCEVRDTVSEAVASDSMELIIHYAPRWDNDYVQKAAGSEGTTVDVKCVVHSLPVASFYWIKNGNNLTSSADYFITSQGPVSTLRINSVQNSDYGTFECCANNYVGGRNFSIQFTTPGIPDSPDECILLNVTDRQATIQCEQGYDGGEKATFTFMVKKSTPHQSPTEVTSTFIWKQDALAEISVSELEPNNNYTLLVYQENKYGHSSSSFGVLTNTLDGPPLDEKMSTEMIAIIAGSVGGAVLVVAIVLIVCCVCRRPKKEAAPPKLKHNTTKSSSTKKKDVQSYVMEDDVIPRNESRDNTRSSLRDLRNSFRMRRQPRVLSAGINNPNYLPDEGHTSPKIVLDFTGDPSRPETTQNSAYFVNLNHEPGETPDGVYENAAYLRESRSNLNTSISSSVPSEVLLRRQQSADPLIRAQRQSKEQPGLAGFGALQDLDMMRLADGPLPPQPLTPTIRKEVRLSLRPPSFEPEVPWEFPREKLFVRLKVGEGTFGEVWRAKADGILGRPGRVAIAVKMLKVHFTPEERRSLIKELEIMKLLQPHPNVIQLLGCCSKSDPLCIIMEYAANGNLQELLRRQRSAFSMNDLSQDSPESNRSHNINLQLKDLKRFGLHVASGMEYIASRELLHRDLAARNILVDENLICKVGDFGSARDVIQMRQYESKTQRRLPIRWMPPESLLQCLYTVHSDVWSFGVLLWEIITLGSSPYPGMGGPEVMDFVQKGCRMSKPKHCSDALYAVMKDCWSHYPQKRPSFNILRHRMIAILDEPGDDIYVEQMCDNAYDIVEDLPGEKC